MELTLHLTADQEATVTRLAAQQGIDLHEAVVRAVERDVAGLRARALDRIVTEDRALLDLLAR